MVMYMRYYKVMKSITCGLALLISVSAFAGNQMIDFSSGFASFVSTTPTLSGDHDTLSFVNLAPGTYDFLLNISSKNVSNLGVTINGQRAMVVSFGKLSFAGLESTAQTPFTLDITGLPGREAAYTGDLRANAVPEPMSMSILALGLGGLIARRRKS